MPFTVAVLAAAVVILWPTRAYGRNGSGSERS